MYCTNCGQKIDDDARFCPNCGATIIEGTSVPKSTSSFNDNVNKYHEDTAYDSFQGGLNQEAPIQTPPLYDDMPVDNDNKASILFIILSFMFPIVGLICFFIWKDSKPLKAKPCLIAAIAGWVLGIVTIILN